MPRDLFGDIIDPSITLGTRKWYTVPLSLTVHAAVLALLVIAPLFAVSTLPVPHIGTVFVPVITPPLPDPPRVPRPAPPQERVASRDAAPVTAPDKIVPEPDEQFELDNPIAFDTIVPGSGSIEGEAVVVPPPVVPPPAAAPIRVGGQIRQPERMNYASPEYPTLARTAGVQGLVILEAVIDVDGRVHSARVLRSDSPLLNDAALGAVRQWTYTPTLLNGVPVSVVMTVTVQFRLR